MVTQPRPVTVTGPVMIKVPFLLAGLAAAAFGSFSLLAGPDAAAAQPAAAGGSLAAFRSDAELRVFLIERRKRAQQRAGAYETMDSSGVPAPPPPPPPPLPAAPATQTAPSGAIVVTGSRMANPSITNNQERGVDEGGIVKVIGDKLVVLRRGRIFTVSTAGGRLRPIDYIDAMPPGVSGEGDWYDEMLVHGDRIVVVGYSYARGGTEINRFRMAPNGRLRFEDAYHLRSNDYYSSRNYASRLIGNRLIYYTPLYLQWDDDPFEAFPAVRRWTGDANRLEFTRVTDARETFIAPTYRDNPDAPIDTLHSVMDCDLTAPVLRCDATAVLGPASRTFYVSGNAVYLWVSDAWSREAGRRGGVRSFVYRLPFGRERPSAIGARGNPTDQFSFREDPRAGLLDVLVRADGGGDSMWNPEVAAGDVALLSIPLAWMGDGSREVRFDRYRRLPSPGQRAWNFQNRFVGNHVLYGGGAIGRGGSATLTAAALRGGPVAQIPLGHAIERIDLLGSDGVVIGNDRRGGLNFTAIDLRQPQARAGSNFVMPDAAQGENRSHGFFFRPDDASGDNGLLGLPIARSLRPGGHRFLGSAASILFLARDQRRLRLAGELEADYARAIDDACRASCVDWYGNARPIFLGNRIFALMGYELVEGRMAAGGRIREVGRTDFAPSRDGRIPPP